MKKIYNVLVVAALFSAAACQPEVKPGGDEAPDDQREQTVIDDTMLHNLGADDPNLAQRTRLAAEIYSPSLHKTAYYPIMVDRAQGSVADRNNIAWKPQKTRILYNICNSS